MSEEKDSNKVHSTTQGWLYKSKKRDIKIPIKQHYSNTVNIFIYIFTDFSYGRMYYLVKTEIIPSAFCAYFCIIVSILLNVKALKRVILFNSVGDFLKVIFTFSPLCTYYVSYTMQSNLHTASNHHNMVLINCSAAVTCVKLGLHIV